MFVCFDYRCPTCGHEEERFVRRDQMDEQFCPNYLGPHDKIACGSYAPMTRLPAGTRTTFRFADTKLKR